MTIAWRVRGRYPEIAAGGRDGALHAEFGEHLGRRCLLVGAPHGVLVRARHQSIHCGLVGAAQQFATCRRTRVALRVGDYRLVLLQGHLVGATAISGGQAS